MRRLARCFEGRARATRCRPAKSLHGEQIYANIFVDGKPRSLDLKVRVASGGVALGYPGVFQRACRFPIVSEDRGFFVRSSERSSKDRLPDPQQACLRRGCSLREMILSGNTSSSQIQPISPWTDLGIWWKEWLRMRRTQGSPQSTSRSTIELRNRDLARRIGMRMPTLLIVEDVC